MADERFSDVMQQERERLTRGARTSSTSSANSKASLRKSIVSSPPSMHMSLPSRARQLRPHGNGVVLHGVKLDAAADGRHCSK